MNTNYINKYIKYKNKYINYINQYGGKCAHLITETGLINNDLVTEESYTDTRLICRTVYSLVNDISNGVGLINTGETMPTKFPSIPIPSGGNNMTIHDIWNTIILNNKVTKELNIKSSQTDQKYIYIINKENYYFINECLKILTYNDIYSYTDCTNDNIIPSRTLNKLQKVIISNENIPDSVFFVINLSSTKTRPTTSVVSILTYLLDMIYLIVLNKI